VASRVKLRSGGDSDQSRTLKRQNVGRPTQQATVAHLDHVCGVLLSSLNQLDPREIYTRAAATGVDPRVMYTRAAARQLRVTTIRKRIMVAKAVVAILRKAAMKAAGKVLTKRATKEMLKLMQKMPMSRPRVPTTTAEVVRLRRTKVATPKKLQEARGGINPGKRKAR
jgi:hypothetical protein